jgi:hypothetical protein
METITNLLAGSKGFELEGGMAIKKATVKNVQEVKASKTKVIPTIEGSMGFPLEGGLTVSPFLKFELGKVATDSGTMKAGYEVGGKLAGVISGIDVFGKIGYAGAKVDQKSSTGVITPIKVKGVALTGGFEYSFMETLTVVVSETYTNYNNDAKALATNLGVKYVF